MQECEDATLLKKGDTVADLKRVSKKNKTKLEVCQALHHQLIEHVKGL